MYRVKNLATKSLQKQLAGTENCHVLISNACTINLIKLVMSNSWRFTVCVNYKVPGSKVHINNNEPGSRVTVIYTIIGSIVLENIYSTG